MLTARPLLAAILTLASTSVAAQLSPLAPAQQSHVDDILGPYAVGADVSFLKQAEDNGLIFKDEGVPKDGLQLLEDHGYNWIRLRVFVDPAKAKTDLPNTLAYAIALSKRAKAHGMKVEIGLHYSDTWSDRFHQVKPSAWTDLQQPALEKAVEAYTRDCIKAFREAGAMPDMFQIGNEPTLGFLWPEGRIPDHWAGFAGLYRAAVRGLDEGRANLPRPLLLVQLDLGGDARASQAWFDKFATYHLPVDVVAESYYAHDFHSLLELRQNLANLAQRYGRDVIVVETSYTWKPGKAFIPDAGPFPETPEGQAHFLDELNRIVMDVPNVRGRGVFWWEPFWPRPGVDRGMFDADGNALPVLKVYDKWTGGKASRTHTPLATPQLTGSKP